MAIRSNMQGLLSILMIPQRRIFASPIGAGKCAIEEELGGIGLCADNIILSDDWHWADTG